MAAAGIWLGWLLWQAVLAMPAAAITQDHKPPLTTAPVVTLRPVSDPPPAPSTATTKPSIPSISKSRRIDEPDADYRVAPLAGGSVVVLNGRVRTLFIEGLDTRSTLDASGLQAKEIIVSGKIDGRSTVRLNAPGGRIEVHGKTEGDSRVEIVATGGTIVFSDPATPQSPGSKIDGNAQVFLTAKTVDLRGILNGTETRVVVTLTDGGTLRFKEIAGAALLCYRKNAPGDPAPRIEAGVIQGAAQLIKLD
jgi:hypothetical protein